MSLIKTIFLQELESHLHNYPGFIQILLGPRQVGKTTGVLQLAKTSKEDVLYFSSDEEISPTSDWIEQKWQLAQLKNSKVILILDEVQKIPQWSSMVKKIWDQQKSAHGAKIKLVLLGSSSLDLQKGLTESLTGRFQLIKAHHWNYQNSYELKKMSVEDFVQYGGYPGSYELFKNKKEWDSFIKNSIIETVINKDILNFSRVTKPAVFKQAFQILMSYPAQDISYTKLLGQLQDKGNTDLIKHYIDLYEGAFLIKSVQKYAEKSHLSRASSPKIIPLCGALIDRSVFDSKEGYGRAFEAAVGAALLNSGFEIFYWREGSDEVDFVVPYKKQLLAIEVKSGRKKSAKGLAEFSKRFKKVKSIFITPDNIEVFLKDPNSFFEKIG